MDCPNCGVYNPEERGVCWRCSAELPKAAPPKRRSSQQRAQFWLYVAIIGFALVTALRMCGGGPDWLNPEAPLPPEGSLSRPAPVVHILDAGEDPLALL